MFAGPNGSGKSTITDEFLKSGAFDGVLYVNADRIEAEELGHIPNAADRSLAAANLAEARRRDALASRKPFAFESVGSTPGRIAWIDEAKASGFHVDLIVVTTADPQINVTRVEGRVQKGGHPVAPDKVLERYARMMELLPAALEKADGALVFDNSSEGVGTFARVASKAEGRIAIEDEPRGWVKKFIVEPLRAREASRAALAAIAGPGSEVNDAAIGGNAKYSGVVAAESDVHVLQRIAGTKDKYVLHDKALCQPRGRTVGKATVMTYEFGADGKHKALDAPANSRGRGRSR